MTKLIVSSRNFTNGLETSYLIADWSKVHSVGSNNGFSFFKLSLRFKLQANLDAIN